MCNYTPPPKPHYLIFTLVTDQGTETKGTEQTELELKPPSL